MGKSVQQMQFTLTGFTQDEGCRVFAFEGIGEDRARIKFTVRADLALSRKYGIRLQELPLMCLAILERKSVIAGVDPREPAGLERDLTFTEEAMKNYADECNAARDEAALKRSSSRRQTPQPDAEDKSDPYAPKPLPVNPFGQNW